MATEALSQNGYGMENMLRMLLMLRMLRMLLMLRMVRMLRMLRMLCMPLPAFQPPRLTRRIPKVSAVALP